MVAKLASDQKQEQDVQDIQDILRGLSFPSYVSCASCWFLDTDLTDPTDFPEKFLRKIPENPLFLCNL
jgi:hypothetical protein